jgi:hypothetical protein
MTREAVLGVVEALEALSVPYMVVGSFSSNVYGIARSTQDADFVVELGSTAVGAIAAKLGPKFILNPQMSFETITSTSRFDLKYKGSGFKIELFLLSDDPHDQERFCRRKKGVIFGRSVWVPTAEDVGVTKLRWSRLGKRTKDIDDVRSVLTVQGDRLDWDYVQHWGDAHGTRELLEEVRRGVPKSGSRPTPP